MTYRHVLATLALVACSGPITGSGENVLIILSDDIGLDRHGLTSLYDAPSLTPTIDALATEGIRFEHAYATPSCSPTRATSLTGRLPTRHGVGRWISPAGTGRDLALRELTIPEQLDKAGYTSAVVGKWHLSSFQRDRASMHPLNQGFDHHRGAMANPRAAVRLDDATRGYFHWEKNTDGDLAYTDVYMTTDAVDEALDLMQEMPEPWFIWLAFNAAHEPWHVPPDHLNPMGVTEADSATRKFEADILAFDLELGRMLDSMDPQLREDLTLIYLSDNGTPRSVIEAPYDDARGKGTVFEAGVRVPMIVTGPHVAEAGSVSTAMVHVSDLFPTVAEIAGFDPTKLRHRSKKLTLDGTSFLPLLADADDPGPREFMFSETFHPNGNGPYEYRRRTVRSHTHSLQRIEDAEGVATDHFYDLFAGTYDEGPPLDIDSLTPAQQSALDALAAEMDRLDGELKFDW